MISGDGDRTLDYDLTLESSASSVRLDNVSASLSEVP